MHVEVDRLCELGISYVISDIIKSGRKRRKSYESEILSRCCQDVFDRGTFFFFLWQLCGFDPPELKFSTFQLSLAAVYNLIGRHEWECKLEWVRMWNVPQPIRRLNLRLTANQVMALQVPERPLNSAQRTFLKRS